MIEAQRQAQPKLDTTAYFALMRRMVQARRRFAGYRLMLKRRLEDSTSLTPVWRVLARLTASADLLYQPIDEALTEALG